MNKLAVLLIFISSNIYSSELDDQLQQRIAKFKLKPLSYIEDNSPKLTRLGEELFQDNILSRHNNISCQTCHNPEFGTSDALPLSIGEGGVGEGSDRVQAKGLVTARHANHLFNKGHEVVKHMFWDGRVHITSDGFLQTPEPTLNGAAPIANHIASLLKTPLEAQAIFPIASDAEMFGQNIEGLNNLEKWKVISDKVMTKAKYRRKFRNIFKVKEKDFNIGYVAKALAHFQKITFQVTNTKWDKYLGGRLDALTESQKKGALIFMSKGRCIACHNGPLLGGKAFQNSASPQLTQYGNKKDDLGRYDLTGMENHKYMFKIPPLRNLDKTAPYFHTGSVKSLEEVVDHYNDPWNSLRNFSTYITMGQYYKNYVQNFVEMSDVQINGRLDKLPMFYRHHGPLGLSYEEKNQLVDFLRNGLKR